MSELRPWPVTVPRSSLSREFFAHYRAAFDADPDATFCAGERDGVTVVVAVGWHAEDLHRLVEKRWCGVVERRRAGGDSA